MVVVVMVMMPGGSLCRGRGSIEWVDGRQGSMQTSQNGSFLLRLMTVMVVTIEIG